MRSYVFKQLSLREMSRRGIVTIPLVIGLAFVVLTLGLGVATFGFNENEASKASTKSYQALLYARAGLNDALRRLALDKNYEPPASTACYPAKAPTTYKCYMIDFVPNGCSTNAGCARVTASGTASPRTIISEGRFNEYIRKATTTVIVGTDGQINDVAWEEYIPANPKYYWVGGSGSWSDTNHWSLASGGTAGEGPPGPNNDVEFNDASGPSGYNVSLPSVAGSSRAKNVIFNTPDSISLDAAYANKTLEINGSLTLSSGVRSSSAEFLFAGSRVNTITANGANPTDLDFRFSGAGSWTLQDNLNLGAGSITLENGSFDTAGKNVTAGKLVTSGTGARALYIGNSQITLSGYSNIYNNAFVWDLRNNQNLDFTYSSGSKITLTGVNDISTSCCANPPRQVVFAGASSGKGSAYDEVVISANGVVTILGDITFSKLTRNPAAPTSTPYYVNELRFGGNQTITGDFTVTSPESDANTTGFKKRWRILVGSSEFGVQRSVKVGNTATISHVDIQDIKAEENGWTNPLNVEVGDALGNSPTVSGIFAYARLPKTKYWRCAGTCISNTSGDWLDGGAWSDSSVGLGGDGAPLPQDNVVFDSNSGLASTIRVDINRLAKDIDFSNVTGNPSWHFGHTSGLASIYGSFKAGTVTYSANYNQGLSFETRSSSAQIDSNDKLINMPIVINSVGGTITLAEKLIAQDLYLDRGTLVSPNVGPTERAVEISYGINLSRPACPNSTYCTRALTMGLGKWKAGGGWDANPSTNLTLNAGSSTIEVINDAQYFDGGGLTYNNVTVGQVDYAGINAAPRELNFEGNNIINGTLTVLGNVSTAREQVTYIRGENSINTLKIHTPDASARDQTVKFMPGKLTTVSVLFEVEDSSSRSVKLTSSTTGAQWRLKVPQLEVIKLLDVRDSDASESNPNKMDNICSNALGSCVSRGNNKCWVFQAPHPTDATCPY